MKYVKAYSGNQNYIFISYAHRDTEKVLPIIKNLIDSGYRTWYDEGIEPGKDWDNYIAEHVLNCSYFIAFVSDSYLASSNCTDELNFARDENKKLLLVYLNPIELPAGMRMRLNRIQAINKYAIPTESLFYEKLFQAEDIGITLDSSSTPKNVTSNVLEIGTFENTDYVYTGQTLNGDANGNGKVVWKAGGEWEGEFINNKPIRGNGVWYFPDGVYEGEITDGKKNGRGKIAWTDGGEWEGIWENDSPDTGNGKTYFSKNLVFLGSISQKLPHGYGKVLRNNVVEWEGTWASGRKITGKGSVYIKDEGTYTGDYRDGKAHGLGKMKWTNGREWEGLWKNNLAINVNFGNGNIYSGELHLGHPEGQGKVIWANGGEWEGTWKDDKPLNGKGVVYFAKGVYTGELKNGAANGYGKFKWNESGTWEGEFKNNNFLNGKGAYYGDEGIYWGTMQNGKYHGEGKIARKDGSLWQGEWKNGIPFNGSGTVWFFDNGLLNSRYEGELKNGFANGKGTLYWATTDPKSGERVITGKWVFRGEFRNNQCYNGEGHNGPNQKISKIRNGRVVLF